MRYAVTGAGSGNPDTRIRWHRLARQINDNRLLHRSIILEHGLRLYP